MSKFIAALVATLFTASAFAAPAPTHHTTKHKAAKHAKHTKHHAKSHKKAHAA